MEYGELSFAQTSAVRLKKSFLPRALTKLLLQVQAAVNYMYILRNVVPSTLYGHRAGEFCKCLIFHRTEDESKLCFLPCFRQLNCLPIALNLALFRGWLMDKHIAWDYRKIRHCINVRHGIAINVEYLVLHTCAWQRLHSKPFCGPTLCAKISFAWDVP